MDFYIWKEHRCVYDTVHCGTAQGTAKSEAPFNKLSQNTQPQPPALLLIHPIGVGLSRHFWQPFIQQYQQSGVSQTIYNLDLLGCGDSAMPQRAYRPQDWAEQIAAFIEKVATRPVILVVQGALLPVAVRLMSLAAANAVQGLILSGPPAWPLMTSATPEWKTKLAWSFFSSPLGYAFYQYARRESFLKSFSERQLFASSKDVNSDWLSMLHQGSRDMNSRYAVFSFLAGFWRQDYSEPIARIQQPALIVMGEEATTIDRTVARQVDNPASDQPKPKIIQKRLQDYLDHFPRAEGVTIAGRNVLPYESTVEFTEVVQSFVADLAK